MSDVLDQPMGDACSADIGIPPPGATTYFDDPTLPRSYKHKIDPGSAQIARKFTGMRWWVLVNLSYQVHVKNCDTSRRTRQNISRCLSLERSETMTWNTVDQVSIEA
jgi:hypothetical protein